MVENQKGGIPETQVLIDAILTRHPQTSVWFHTVVCVFYPYLLFVWLQHAENHAIMKQGYVILGTLQGDCHLPKGLTCTKRQHKTQAACRAPRSTGIYSSQLPTASYSHCCANFYFESRISHCRCGTGWIQ